jgi:short-subunit dehydrogenase
MSKVIVIIGAGNGISKSVAEKFGKENFSVCLLSRRKEKLEKLTAELVEKGIDAHFFVADAGDSETMKDAFDQIWEKFDFVDVLHYNAAKLKQVNIINETSDSLTRDFKLNVGGVMTALKLVLPDMEKKTSGTILLTGGGFALQPDPLYGSLAIGKAGLRNLAQSLNTALSSKNIFVGTVTVCGFVSENSEQHSPTIIAERFWQLYSERNTWEIQV